MPRQCVPELMDDPALAADRHQAALRALARLNRFSGSAGGIWDPVWALARREGLRRLRLLDVATGSGDIPVALLARARRVGLELSVTGVDVSSRAITEARRRAGEAGVDASFSKRDVLCEGLPDGFDVVTCSLFLHHLSDQQAEDLLREMAGRCERLVVIQDLRRGPGALLLTQVAVRLLTRSPVVQTDGPRSVRAAFTPVELQRMARRAGMQAVQLRRRWPCRLVLAWEKGT